MDIGSKGLAEVNLIIPQSTSITLTGGTHSGTTYDFSDVAYMRLSCNSIDASSAIYVE